MEANWSMIAVVAFATSMGVYMGRLWFKRWFNPLSIYSAIWGFCLCNYALGLIQYYPISLKAWVYIVIAWVSLYLGAATVLLQGPARKQSVYPTLAIDLNCMKKAIFALSVIGSLGLLSQLVAISREFGNPVVALIVNASDIYGARTSNELSALSYVGAFSFAACSLAGVYTAKAGKLTAVAVIPAILVAMQLVAVMGRTGLGMAAVLFLASYVHSPRTRGFRVSKWQRIVAVALVVILLAGFFLVSSVRKLDVDFPGITPSMERISEWVPFFPSLYSNFSATPVAFSMYLSNPEDKNAGFWGMYTFAPIFRFLSRLGFQKSVPPYEENYYTPVPVNTSTYLKNVHSDFGFAGILIFPYLLGAVTTLLIVRTSTRPRVTELVTLSNLYVLAVFAFSFNFMLLGDWYIGLAASILAAFAVDVQAARIDHRKLLGGTQVLRRSA